MLLGSSGLLLLLPVDLCSVVILHCKCVMFQVLSECPHGVKLSKFLSEFIVCFFLYKTLSAWTVILRNMTLSSLNMFSAVCLEITRKPS